MLKSILSGWGTTILSVVSSYLTLPVVIASLPRGEYGTYLVLSSTLSFSMLLTLGIPMASVKEFAECIERKQESRLDELASTSFAFFSLIALFVGIAGMVLGALYRPENASLSAVSTRATVLTATLLSVSFGSSILQIPAVGLLSALGDFTSRNAIVAFGVFLRTSAILFLLPRIAEMQVIAGIMAMTGVLELLATLRLVKLRFPAVSISAAKVRPVVMRPLLGFSVYVLVLTAASQISFQTAPVIIGSTLGEASIPPYSVSSTILLNVIQLSLSIAAVVMPKAAKAASANDITSLVAVFEEWVTLLALLAVSFVLFSLSTGESFLHWWLDGEIARDAVGPFVILALSSLLFLPARGVALPLLMGIGKAKAPTLAFLIAGGLNVVISYLLAPRLGLNGVALGCAIPNALVGIVILGLTSQALGHSQMAFFSSLLLRVLPLAALAGFAAIFANKSFTSGSLAGIATASAAIVAFFVVPAAYLMRAKLHSFNRIFQNR